MSTDKNALFRDDDLDHYLREKDGMGQVKEEKSNGNGGTGHKLEEEAEQAEAVFQKQEENLLGKILEEGRLTAGCEEELQVKEVVEMVAEAMYGSGTLTITTSPAPDRKTVLVEFTDTGEGIPEENFTRIFDPFFTTKEVGKGTGLGLALVAEMARLHGGSVHAASSPGEGSRKCVLPRAILTGGVAFFEDAGVSGSWN